MSVKSYSLHDLAVRVAAAVEGDGQRMVTGVATLAKANANQIAFCTGSRYTEQLKTTRAAAVLLRKEQAPLCPTNAIVVDDPYFAYAELADLLHPHVPARAGVHASAVIAEDAVLEEGVAIGPAVVIESGARIGRNSELGAGCYIGAGATVGAHSRLVQGVHLGHGCTLGTRTLVHAGVVIGADGFGFAPHGGVWRKVPQLGVVRIGDDVEIGANSTIDRGALDDTIIEQGVKLDNLVQIAHNVYVGRNTAIAGCTVVAGSTTIGKNCVIGGQSAITGHISICDDVTIMGMTGVTHSIKEPGVYSSPIPARPVKSWRKNVVRFMQLEDMFNRLKALEKHVPSYKTGGNES